MHPGPCQPELTLPCLYGGLSNEFEGSNLNHNQVAQLMDYLTEFDDLFGMESKVIAFDRTKPFLKQQLDIPIEYR